MFTYHLQPTIAKQSIQFFSPTRNAGTTHHHFLYTKNYRDICTLPGTLPIPQDTKTTAKKESAEQTKLVASRQNPDFKKRNRHKPHPDHRQSSTPPSSQLLHTTPNRQKETLTLSFIPRLIPSQPFQPPPTTPPHNAPPVNPTTLPRKPHPHPHHHHKKCTPTSTPPS